MQNYANHHIILEIQEDCKEISVKVTILISESGQAITAHYTVVIFDVLYANTISSILPLPREKKKNLIN